MPLPCVYCGESLNVYCAPWSDRKQTPLTTRSTLINSAMPAGRHIHNIYPPQNYALPPQTLNNQVNTRSRPTPDPSQIKLRQPNPHMVARWHPHPVNLFSSAPSCATQRAPRGSPCTQTAFLLRHTWRNTIHSTSFSIRTPLPESLLRITTSDIYFNHSHPIQHSNGHGSSNPQLTHVPPYPNFFPQSETVLARHDIIILLSMSLHEYRLPGHTWHNDSLDIASSID